MNAKFLVGVVPALLLLLVPLYYSVNKQEISHANCTQDVVQCLRAAEGGNAEAQLGLAKAYITGDQVERNPERGLIWLRMSADLGNKLAEFTLGNIYLEKFRSQSTDEEAIRLFRDAARDGDQDGLPALARAKLFSLYSEQRGVPKDDTLAVAWFRHAAQEGDAVAQVFLGRMLAEGQGVARNESQAVSWFRVGADHGYATAQVFLGLMFAYGYGIERNEAEAAAWYRKAAEQDDPAAQSYLATMYLEGRGIARDHKQAAYWYRRAAERTDAEARNYLSILFGTEGLLPARATNDGDTAPALSPQTAATPAGNHG